MSGSGTNVKGMNLYNKAKREYASDDCPRKDYYRRDNPCSIFMATPVSTGSSGIGTLALVAGGIGIAAAATPIVAMALTSGGAGAQGAGGPQVSSKATLQALQTAGDSTNPEAINRAIDAGRADSKRLGEQLKTAQDSANKTQAEIDTVNKNISGVKSDISNLEKNIKDKQNEVSGSNGSSSLTSTRDGEIAKVPQKVLGPNGTMIDNPTKDADIQAIHKNYDDRIKHAKEVEEQIPKMQKELEDKKPTLKNYEDVLKDRREKYNASIKQAQEIIPQQKQIDAEVIKLEKRLVDVQNATKQGGANTPAAATAATTSPAAASAVPPAAAPTGAATPGAATPAKPEPADKEATPPPVAMSTLPTVSDQQFQTDKAQFNDRINNYNNQNENQNSVLRELDTYISGHKLTDEQAAELYKLRPIQSSAENTSRLSSSESSSHS